MPSKSYTNRLETVLADADEINIGHQGLRTGNAGRQYGLGALNRAVVVMSVSAWETYLEEVLKEVLVMLKPPQPPLGVWPSMNALARSQIGRFNNPNVQNTKDLFRDCIGLEDISFHWRWKHNDPQKACRRLEEAIRYRHHIAHGVVPRPVIHNQQYARRLPIFFRKLGNATDTGITKYFANHLGIATGW